MLLVGSLSSCSLPPSSHHFKPLFECVSLPRDPPSPLSFLGLSSVVLNWCLVFPLVLCLPPSHSCARRSKILEPPSPTPRDTAPHSSPSRPLFTRRCRFETALNSRPLKRPWLQKLWNRPPTISASQCCVGWSRPRSSFPMGFPVSAAWGVSHPSCCLARISANGGRLCRKPLPHTGSRSHRALWQTIAVGRSR